MEISLNIKKLVFLVTIIAKVNVYANNSDNLQNAHYPYYNQMAYSSQDEEDEEEPNYTEIESILERNGVSINLKEYLKKIDDNIYYFEEFIAHLYDYENVPNIRELIDNSCNELVQSFEFNQKIIGILTKEGIDYNNCGISPLGDDFPNKTSTPLLSLAIRSLSTNFFDFLLTVPGIDFNFIDNEGNIALHYVADVLDLEENYEIITKMTNILLQGTSNINVVNSDGFTPINLAAVDRSLTLAKILIKFPTIDLSVVDNSGLTFFHLLVSKERSFAFSNNSEEVLKENLQPISVKKVDEIMDIFLSTAENIKNTQGIRNTIWYASGFYSQDNNGKNVFHYILEMKNYDFLNIFIKVEGKLRNILTTNGISPINMFEVRDKYGKIPCDY